MMRLWLSLLCAFALCAAAAPQQDPSDIPEIASHAGIIFRGTVLAVTAESPHAPGEVAVTRVTFRVDDGIRNAVTGQTLTIRQWNAADDDYRVGETILLFLYAPSDELGLTSPVGGPAGHRRLEEVPPEVLDRLRTARSLAPGSPPPADPPRRPARPARSRP